MQYSWETSLLFNQNKDPGLDAVTNPKIKWLIYNIQKSTKKLPKSMSDNQIKLISFQLVPNTHFTPHDQSQIQHLVKKGVLSKDIGEYNNMLIQYIKEEKKNIKQFNIKQLELDRSLSDIDRTQIVNNCYRNKAELILKVPAAAGLSEKQVKNILQQQK